MSKQIPLLPEVYYGMPPLPIDGHVLARFTIEMAVRLHDLEQRFATPREHPRMAFEQSRGVSRRPC